MHAVLSLDSVKMSNDWTRRWRAPVMLWWRAPVMLWLVYYTCASHSGQGLFLITTKYWTVPKVRSVSTTALTYRLAINKIPNTGPSVPITDLLVMSIAAEFGLCNLFFVLDDMWLFFCVFIFFCYGVLS